MKILNCISYVFKSFASISRQFHAQIVLSRSSMLHCLENLVIAHCGPDFSAYLAKFVKISPRVKSENITS